MRPRVKNHHNRNVVLTVAGILLAIVIIVGLYLIWSTAQKPGATEAQKPSFVFTAANAPGWWTGGNNWPDATQYEGNQADLSIATMNIMQGTKDTPGDCFVLFSYKKGTVDVQTVLEDRKAGLIMGSEETSSVEQIGSRTQTMRTPEGEKEYTLYQYNLIAPESQQVQRGNEFGYVALSDSYIELWGVCPTADELAVTLDGISAVILQP